MTDAKAETPGAVARIASWVKYAMATLPARAMQRFSARNGPILAAGASYQALFAIFAALYVAFAGLGLWLGGNADVIDRIIQAINGYLPGLIGESGIVSADAVHQVASQSLTTLGITGVIAIFILLATAIGWIGAVRNTVRDIFGLANEQGNPVLLKLRDLGAAAGFALLLLLGAVLGWMGTAALEFVFGLIGLPEHSVLMAVIGRTATIAVTFAVNTVTLWMLFRFLTGTALSTRDVLPGSLLGAAGVTVLQLAFGYLVGKAPNNPLLVTFAVLIGLLLWIRLVMTVILIAAAWVAESADDHDLPLEHLDDDARALREADILAEAARLQLAEAESRAAEAKFGRRRAAKRELAHAQNRLELRERQRAELDE